MKTKFLQLAYANLMAETAAQFTKHGILEKVQKEKYLQQLSTGKGKAAAMGITNPKEVFETVSSTFGCANWEVKEYSSEITAETSNCMLCALAKKYNSNSPCKLYCLNPLESLVKGLDPALEFHVKSTLFESMKCEVTVHK